MLLISIFLQLIRSDECPDYKIPSASRSFINTLRSLKSSRTMLLFGVDSYADFPVVSSFEELKEKVLPFLMGQFYTNFLIIILGLVAFFFFLSCTILITTCCTPRERSKPGFFTTIIWWIIFSILYLVSIIYFILSIAYAPKFINNFHEIPDVVQNSFSQIINDVNTYISKYEKNAIDILNGTGTGSVYPSLALLMENRSTSKIDAFIYHLDVLKDTLIKVNESLCNFDGNSEQPNCAFLNQYVSTFKENLMDININTFIENSNVRAIYRQNSLTIPVMYDFSNLKWIDAQMAITKYRFDEVEKSKKSFDTDRDYVNIPLKCFNIIILILVIIFYVFQTITFFTQWEFSRCCVISIFPIAMVTSVGIAIFGIFATSVSCAIGDVCAESSRFVSQYFFLRNETRLNFPFPAYNPGLFDSPNENLFTAIGGEYIFNFNDMIDYENTTNVSNLEIRAPYNLDCAVPGIINGDGFSYSEIYTELMKLYEALGNDYSKSVMEGKDTTDVLNEIRNVFEVISDVNYKYHLLFNVIEIIKAFYNESWTSSGYIKEYFDKSKSEFIPKLQNFTLQKQVNTASFCCPVNQVKKIFCQDTSATFSCFSIFAHFYLLSLIGFGIVLCFRRQGMLSSNYGIEDDKNEKKKEKYKDQSSDFEPRTTDFIRTNQGTSNRELRNWVLSDASDSESKSSFTTLDMYAQSKIL